jgi:hypothetical protein
MNLEQVSAFYRQQGYTARAGVLYAPNGLEVRHLVRSGRSVFLPETVANLLEDMQHAQRERTGKTRDLRGTLVYRVGKIGE